MTAPPASTPSPAAVARRSPGRLRAELAVLAAALVSAVVVWEGHFRLRDAARPHPPRGLFQLDAYSGYSIRANLRDEPYPIFGSDRHYHVTTTVDGLRRSTPVDVSDDAQVVFFTGDSFFFGAQVEESDTAAAVLEHRLQADTGPRGAAVLNGGLPGGTTVMSVCRYLGVGRKYRPRVVVCCQCPQQAVPNPPDYAALARGQTDPDFAAKLPYFIDAEGVLRYHVTEVAWLRPACRASALVRHLVREANQTSPERSRETLREAARATVRDPAAAIAPFVELDRWVRRDGGRTIVVLRPDPWGLSADVRPSVYEVTRDALRAEGITVIDLAAVLDGRTDVYAADAHWNATGHRLVADLIYREIRRSAAPSSAEPPANLERLSERPAGAIRK